MGTTSTVDPPERLQAQGPAGTPSPAAPSPAAPGLAAPGLAARRPVTAALTGSLVPAYREELATQLRAADVAASTLERPSGLPELVERLGGTAALVVVLPGEQASLLDEALAGVWEGPPAWTVVHVVADASPQQHAAALRAGATGVVAQDAGPAEAVDVVVAAATGRTLLPPGVAEVLSRSASPDAPRLEPHERAWLRSLADSGTAGALARSSGCSEQEMYRLLADVYARLGARDRTEALLRAERLGLLGGDRP